jgi:hypothetical protein
MKLPHIAIVAVMVAHVVAHAGAAEENRARAAVPQPRARLDPVTRTAIAEPRAEEKKAESAAVVKLSPYIVRSTPLVVNEAEQEQDQPIGPFAPSTGGWVIQKDRGALRFEVGSWPYRNILWKNDRFKSDKKNVGTGFFRVSW